MQQILSSNSTCQLHVSGPDRGAGEAAVSRTEPNPGLGRGGIVLQEAENKQKLVGQMGKDGGEQ